MASAVLDRHQRKRQGECHSHERENNGRPPRPHPSNDINFTKARFMLDNLSSEPLTSSFLTRANDFARDSSMIRAAFLTLHYQRIAQNIPKPQKMGKKGSTPLQIRCALESGIPLKLNTQPKIQAACEPKNAGPHLSSARSPNFISS